MLLPAPQMGVTKAGGDARRARPFVLTLRRPFRTLRNGDDWPNLGPEGDAWEAGVAVRVDGQSSDRRGSGARGVVASRSLISKTLTLHLKSKDVTEQHARQEKSAPRPPRASVGLRV